MARWIVAAALLLMSAGAGATPGVAAGEGLTGIEQRLLAAHNQERVRVGAEQLQWDPDLAQSAAGYGPALAALGRLEHSPRDGRPGQRENLWMGTRGAFAPESMVGTWIAERALLRSGNFPSVSATGRWQDIAHYTQMVWPTTTRVGCAVHSSERYDYLICRYSPPGNRDGFAIPAGWLR